MTYYRLNMSETKFVRQGFIAPSEIGRYNRVAQEMSKGPQKKPLSLETQDWSSVGSKFTIRTDSRADAREFLRRVGKTGRKITSRFNFSTKVR